MPKVDTFKKFLNLINNARYVNAFNLYSPEAKRLDGSLNNGKRIIKTLVEAEYLKPVPLRMSAKIHSKCRQAFYYCTPKIKDFGLKPTYKPHEAKTMLNIEHDSIIADICIAFQRQYPDYSCNFEFDKQIGTKLRPDIVIKMWNKQDPTKRYTFLVEVERKDDPERVINEKIKRYEEFYPQVDKAKFSLDHFTKILFVYTDFDYNQYLRPAETRQPTPETAEMLRLVKYKFTKLLNLLKPLPIKDYYRFIPIYDFYRLNEQVWYNKSGERLKLIK